MKTKLINDDPGFKPVTVEVTFETREELLHVYSCLNPDYNPSEWGRIQMEIWEAFQKVFDQI